MSVSRQRVGIIAPGFSVDEADWCIPALLNLVRELAQQRDVTVYTLRYPHHRRSYTVYGAQVRAFGGATAGGWRRLPLLLRAYRSILADARHQPFSVLHAFWADEAGFVATLAARRLGIPAVVSLMGGELTALRDIGYGVQLSRSGRWLTRAALQRATYVTVGSTYLQTLARSQHPTLPLYTLPLGVDTTLFHPAPAANPPDGPRLLHVASLVPVKDQHTLLHAFAHIATAIPNATLDIIGDGPLRPQLEATARSLGLASRVHFHGERQHHELPPYYQRATLQLISSRYESQSLALLEAAACGLPTVGTAAGLLPDLLPPHCLVPPRDPTALAHAALPLLQNEFQRTTLARQLQERVAQEFTVQHTVSRLLALYEDGGR